MLGLAALISAALGPANARAEGPPPRLCVVVDGPAALDEQLETIRFEVDQAGLAALAPRNAAGGCELTIRLEQAKSSWRLELIDHASSADRALDRRGKGTATPEMTGLMAVELLHAWKSHPTPEPEFTKAEANEANEALAPVARAAAANVQLNEIVSEPAPTQADPASSSPERQWQLDVSSAFSSLGPVGAGLGVRHRWHRVSLGLVAEGAYLGLGDHTSSSDGSKARTEGRGVFRLRLTPSWVFLPGRSVRPHLGLGNELVVAVAQVRVHSLHSDISEPRSGLWWVPSLEAGLYVPVQHKLTFQMSLRAGPSLPLQSLTLASGRRLAGPRWFLGGGFGLVFDLD